MPACRLNASTLRTRPPFLLVIGSLQCLCMLLGFDANQPTNPQPSQPELANLAYNLTYSFHPLTRPGNKVVIHTQCRALVPLSHPNRFTEP